MGVSDDDAGLGTLLVQFLRAVTPAVTGGAALQSAELSVSASEARALVELLAAHGIAQGELAGLLGLEKSTVSRLAAGLEQKGWIKRGRDEGNQRYVRLYLTPSGSAIAARLLQTWQSRQARILASLTDAERAGLAVGLVGLLRGLVAEGLLAGATPRTAARDATPPISPPPRTAARDATPGVGSPLGNTSLDGVTAGRNGCPGASADGEDPASSGYAPGAPLGSVALSRVVRRAPHAG